MTEKKIEFNKMKEIWSELALTGFAKDEIEKATIILEESKLRKELRDTTNAKEMIEKILLIVERLKIIFHVENNMRIRWLSMTKISTN